MNSIEIFSKWIENNNFEKHKLITPLDKIIVLLGYKGVPLIFLTTAQQICFYAFYWVISFGLIYSLLIYFFLDLDSLQKFIDWRALGLLLISGIVFAIIVTVSMRKRKIKYQIPEWDQIKIVKM